MTNAIEASGLVKRFGKTTALAGVDLVARPGTVLGVLGPNGAGKTTAVRILATLLRPDGGQARVCGYDVRRQAAPAGPGRQPGRPAPGAVPGRADHRPGPAEPERRVGHDRRRWPARSSATWCAT